MAAETAAAAKTWLASLNEAQLRAVTAPPEIPLQILAGPGSGKTRVLTSRVAWLVQDQGLKPSQITAVTFTNKAANEMKRRLEVLLGRQAADALVLGTFHATCARYLRRYGKRIGLDNNFAIADADDCKKMMTEILKQKSDYIDKNDSAFKPASVLADISKAKAKGVTPDAMATRAARDPGTSTSTLALTAELYAEYEAALREAGALDFDDLLVFGLRLFREHPQLLDGCFHILVDEFQDTNTTQYELMKCYAQAHGGVTVVGDPDQSIYGWRSAEIENLDKMTKGVQAIYLEQNYRSTGAILAASHAIVSQDRTRIQKQLYTSHPHSTAVTLKQFGTPVVEASFIATEIKRLVAYTGGILTYDDFAILIRSSALSRNIEAALQKDRIPSRLIGGHKFFERMEIKDLLAYLQLADNPNFSPAFMRVVNVPRRSIGDKSVADLVAAARAAKCSPMELCERVVDGDKLPPGIKPVMKKNLAAFVGAVRKLRRAAVNGKSVADLIRLAIEKTGYEDWLRTSQQDFEQRWENVQELIAYSVTVAEEQGRSPHAAADDNADSDELSEAGVDGKPTRPLHHIFRSSDSVQRRSKSRSYSRVDDDGVVDLVSSDDDDDVDSPDLPDGAAAVAAGDGADLESESLTPLRYFLQTSMLSTDTEAKDDEAKVPVRRWLGSLLTRKKVTISTVHAAKGLEWPVVFIPAVEQGTFPSYRCTEEHEIAEERRLLYVAMTRAQSFLFRMFGSDEKDKELSEFVKQTCAMQPNLFSSGLPEIDAPVRAHTAAVLARTLADEEDTKAAIHKHVRAAPPLSMWDAPEPRGYGHNRFGRRETTKAARAAEYWQSDVDEYALPAAGASGGSGFAPASSLAGGGPRLKTAASLASGHRGGMRDPPPPPRPQPAPIKSANRALPAPLPFAFGMADERRPADLSLFTSGAGAGLQAMKALGLPPADAPVVSKGLAGGGGGGVQLAAGTKRLGMGRPTPWGAKKPREG